MSSIISNEKRCFFCGNPKVELHHCFYGTANRRKSDIWGCTVYLCYEHHRGVGGVHNNKGLDIALKRYAQKAFEERYPEIDFMTIFGRNYL